MPPKLRRTLVALTALLAWAGCHDSDEVEVDVTAPDVAEDSAAPPDVVTWDTEDPRDTPTGDTTVGDTVGDDTGDADTIPAPGEFGAPCLENRECLSGLCIESDLGPVCSRVCVDDCPEGWRCLGVTSPSRDVVFVCTPSDDRLCRPCAIDRQCGAGYCLTLADGRRCTTPCDATEGCPAGYACESVASEEFPTLESNQCVPVTGGCDCTDGNEGLQQPCNHQNVHGTCWGLQTCLGAEGWSACDAPVPAEEVCDGIDNNCNFLVDEGLVDDTPCFVTNEWGTCTGVRLCGGAQGWLCLAEEASPEVCDYVDNNCDGQVDEGFRDPVTGLYVDDDHCGVCGNSCAGFFPNAVSGCAVVDGVARCVVEECLPGFYQAGPTTCLPVVDAACLPCASDANCVVPGNACVTLDVGSFCAQDCGPGNLNGFPAGECPEGFSCDDLGDGRQQCLPATGSCDCRLPADADKTRPCTRSNEHGTCVGLQACEPETGWTSCGAREPGPELCNGIDDNCNGQIDEGVIPPEDPCAIENEHGVCTGDWICGGTQGWQCTARTPAAEVCDQQDNNCDGQIDEDFRDAETGLYVDDDHCGLCGRACDDVILFASETACALEGGLPVCIALACDEGFFIPPETNRVCIPTSGATDCSPCSDDGQCAELPGGACTDLDGGRYCTRGCADGAECEPGTTCLDGRCLPDTLSCTCLPGMGGALRPCANQNAFGTCTGTELCDPLTSPGWSTCSARVPAEETCNGVDDNCNGLVDEGVTHSPATCEIGNEFGVCSASYFCAGAGGWQCPVQVPMPETCNFQDDNCDGRVDEDFRDEAGRYVDDEHCGTCDFSCAGVIPNATATCAVRNNAARCEVATCDVGYYQLGPLTCLPATDTTCAPCVSDANCPTPGDRCLDLDGGSFCGRDCGPDNVHGTPAGICDPGYTCAEVQAEVFQCVPSSGSCSCREGDDGKLRSCAVTNDAGTCLGTEICASDLGWEGCTARVPAEETCNGVDDNCNGQIDEGVSHDPPSCEVTNAWGTCTADYVCRGVDGWQCDVRTPAPEACNGLDDNCDGQVDEDFRDGLGRYVHVEHCGACGITCVGAIPNATATCAIHNGAPRCEVAACDPGYYPASPLACLPVSASTCLACATDANCPTPGDRCLELDGGRFCGRDCGEDNFYGDEPGECPEGFTCAALGGETAQCIPRSGSCTCLLDDQGATRTCVNTGAAGTCFGTETCDPEAGWVGCTAQVPAPEVCNGLDDNCNGQIDEGLTPPVEPCEVTVEGVGTCEAAWQCAGAAGWQCPAATPAPETCNFQDDDCDGQVDNGFRDAAGRYVHDQHCGSCGISCAGAIPNATATCAVVSGQPRCVVASCDPGFYQAGPLSCLAATSDLCLPCASDADCPTPGDRCVALAGGSFCGMDCGEGNLHGLTPGTCDSEGFTCAAVAGGGPQCVPTSGACDCLPGNAGAGRVCSRQNSAGTCFGTETCDPGQGWVGCSAQVPTGEICNGLDDNCNGQVDEGVSPPAAACEVTVEGVGTCAASWQCQGTAGWVCPAPTPTPEVCNFMDDNCDGQVDEDFRAPSGRYVHDEHCGTCNVSCAGAIPNATATCVETPTSARCEVLTCDPGFYQAGPLTCLPATDSTCSSCASDANCPTPGDLCLALDGGSFCGMDCADGNLHGLDAGTCPAGFSCEDAGGGTRQCVPLSGSCTCLADDDGKTRACIRSNAIGTCFGTEVCDPEAGWLGCTARVPAPEVCDGVDNDCNSAVDDVPGRGEACAITNEHGSCAGVRDCAPGSEELVCVGQTPAPERCNYLDDDCDGVVDNGFDDLNQSCFEGVGACRRFGFVVCTADGTGTTCNAVAGAPSPELCDGVDNDCDGLTDEDFPDKGKLCSAGLGVCRAFGNFICTADGLGVECDAVPLTGGAEVCDGLDNDCDGVVDNGFIDAQGRYVLDTHCGNCFTDCTAIFDRPNAYGVCNTAPQSPSCQLTCCRAGDTEAACDGVHDFYDLNAVPGDGCEFMLDVGAIYVSGSGAAGQDLEGCGLGPVGTGPGGAYFPCRTIGFGIAEAARLGRARVRVADALYNEPVVLVEGVSLLGGHRADTWERNVASTNTTIRGASAHGPHRRTIVADGITSLETVVEGFIIDGPSTFTASGNSYAIWARDSTSALRIEHNIIFGGFGGDGANGGVGGQGADAGHGQRGERAILTTSFELSGCQGHADTPGNIPECFDSTTNQKSPTACGAAGSNTCGGVPVHGGAGAGAVCPSEVTQQAGGAAGLSAGGPHGGAGGGGPGGHDRVSNNCGTFGTGGFSATGLPGVDGVDGDDASGGAGCADTMGTIVGPHWQGSVGAAGPMGSHGGGGGGGGAGGGADVTTDCMTSDGTIANDTLGGSGGGGGAGGCGGLGGLGGQPGGGSFAIFITHSAGLPVESFPVVSGNTITRGVGGDGGNGGPAGRGGLGGNGGDGGLVFGPWGYAMGNGGRGGQGGDGGHGGGGGGGCGGASFGIFVHNALGTPNYGATNAFMPGGDGGQGGAGGASAGAAGAPGSDGIALDLNW